MKTIAPTICSIHISGLEPPDKRTGTDAQRNRAGLRCEMRSRTFKIHVRHERENRRVSTVAAIQSLYGETADNESREDKPVQHPVQSGVLTRTD